VRQPSDRIGCGILIALATLIVAVLAWLFPVQPVGPSPFARQQEQDQSIITRRTSVTTMVARRTDAAAAPTATKVPPRTNTPLPTSIPQMPPLSQPIVVTITPTMVPTTPKYKIAFSSKRNGHYGIYTLDPMNLGAKPVSLLESADYDVIVSSWSKTTGQFLYLFGLYYGSGQGGRRELWVMDRNGSNKKLLTRDMWDIATAQWSPDGNRIAFSSSATSRKNGGSTIIYDTWVMNSDGTGQTEVFVNQALSELSPSWSPLGTSLAFSLLRGNNWDIFVMDSKGLDLRRLVHTPRDDESPAWSPDGEEIAFTSQFLSPDLAGIYTVKSDGSSTMPEPVLERYDVIFNSPAWSPDGSRIAFVSNVNGNNDIFVINRQGGDVVQLTSDTADDIGPVWFEDR
jgi:Tol biopolymer transport system component